MERNAQEQLRAHLMETNEEFRRLAAQHCDYAKKLEAMEALPHLTDQEQTARSSPRTCRASRGRT